LKPSEVHKEDIYIRKNDRRVCGKGKSWEKRETLYFGKKPLIFPRKILKNSVPLSQGIRGISVIAVQEENRRLFESHMKHVNKLWGEINIVSHVIEWR
jgi:hypothetical protein